MRRIIRKNLRPFLAIAGLVVIAIVVGGYILNEQRMRFPFAEEEPFRLNVELDNARAVMPGQGQSAQVAGVRIGDIAEVRLEGGRAVVGLDIEPRYADLIRRDARAQLRPRTGLKDMYVQIFPGKDGRPVKEGFTIPVQSTLTDVDLDEILSVLDARTRDYVTLLANGAGEGLRRRGTNLARVLRRYGPTVRDLGRVNHAVAEERVALRRLVTSLAQVNSTLARKPRDLTQLVSTASTTLRAVGPFAEQLGPTTRALLPAVRELEDVNDAVTPFARDATPIVRREIRPFVRRAQPLARDLAPAARGLSTAFPELRRNTKVLNNFVNMLGHNPRGREAPDEDGREEGYLFWLSWLAHQTTNLQSIDDANGPMRPIFLTGTCTTFQSVVNDTPEAEFALGLSPLLATVCKNPETNSLSTRKALRTLGDLGRERKP
jgi:phospholipid/cholesterol/gamma-HCH transport system substrate-binding protein